MPVISRWSGEGLRLSRRRTRLRLTISPEVGLFFRGPDTVDASFNAADEIHGNADLKDVFKAAIAEGCATIKSENR